MSEKKNDKELTAEEIKALQDKVAKLEGENQKAKEKVASLEEENKIASDLIAEQNEQIARMDMERGSKHPIVKVGKNDFKFIGKGPIIIDGKTYQAKEIQGSPELLEALAKQKSGLLIAVKKGGK